MPDKEIEVKLELSSEEQIGGIEEFLAPYCQGPWQDVVMRAVYYDTEDSFFQQHRIAYRVRQEDDIFVATYKSGQINEHGAFERVEINKIVSTIEPDISVFAQTAVWEQLVASKDAKFVPVVITDFKRHSAYINWGDSIMEVAIDLGFVQGKDKQAPIFELELELTAGEQSDLVELEMLLSERFEIKPSLISKYKKGLILAGL